MKALLFNKPFSEQIEILASVVFPQHDIHARNIILPLELLRPTTIRMLLSQEAAKEVNAEYVEAEYTFSWDEGWDDFSDTARKEKWAVFEYMENEPTYEEWETRAYSIPKYYLVVKHDQE